MKKSIFFVFIITFSNFVFSQGYKITIKSRGLEAKGTAKLAHYYADKNSLKDSCKVKPGGIMVFEGKKKLDAGIYLVVFPATTYIEIVVPKDKQEFYIECDSTTDPLQMVIKNSEENTRYYEFRSLAYQRGREYEDIANDLKNPISRADSIAKRARIAEIEKEISDKRLEIVTKYPHLLTSKIYKALIDITIPDSPLKPDGTEIDPDFRYNYYKNHYFDNMDLGEDAFIRSPLYHNKLKYYFTKLLPQIPDTIVYRAGWLINKIEASIPADSKRDLYRYTVSWITNTYEESKIVCMEKVLWYMATNYYTKGKCPWVDSATVEKFRDHAKKIGPTLCDLKAPQITGLYDSTYMKNINLYDIKAPYTVLIFWDINCGHCQKAMPKLARIYDSMNRYSPYKFEVYAVYSQDNWDGWKKFIRENKLSYINVGNCYGKSKYRDDYYYIATPEILVLDRNKEIKLKKIEVEQLPKILELLYKDEEENKKK